MEIVNNPFQDKPIRGQAYTIIFYTSTPSYYDSFVICKDNGDWVRTVNSPDTTAEDNGLMSSAGYVRNVFRTLTLTAEEMDAEVIMLAYARERLIDMSTLVVSADSESGANVAANVIAYDNTSYWETNLTTGNQSGNAYLKFELAGNSVYQLCMRQKDADSALQSFLIQWSDNDSDWTTVETADFSYYKTGDQWYNHDLDSSIVGRNYLRILANSETGSDKWSVVGVRFQSHDTGTEYFGFGALKTIPAELAAAPAVSSSIEEKITALYQYFFLRRDMTNSAMTMYKDDKATSLCSAAISDDGITVSKGEMS